LREYPAVRTTFLACMHLPLSFRAKYGKIPLIASPGVGKTSLITRTVEAPRERWLKKIEPLD